uniref:D-aminoacyl-tRNA deacylase n=1 Tax=Trypanosoma congolense (strain IL3000) TaxID=1068625 RepID=G0UKU9_TRYCI|nr:conserved hypothetical protein [Trypanosoma congolense IL3000]
MPIRVALQSVEEAELLLDNKQRYASIGRGVIVYVAFLGSINEEALKKALDMLLTANVFHHLEPDGTLTDQSTSLSNYPSADVLIVPQASLGGKLKGRNVQFHALVAKSEGSPLYDRFVKLMREARGIDLTTVDANGVPLPGQEMGPRGRVISGTWGNQQALQLKSRGPLTHVLDL